MTGEPPQGGGRIGQIHQDEPPDDRVESFVGNETVEVGDRKPYPSVLPGLRDPSLGRLDRRGRTIDSRHGAGRADQFARKQGDVTYTAADVQHAHSRPESGPLQHVLRQIADECALHFEAPEFSLALTQHIRSRIRAGYTDFAFPIPVDICGFHQIFLLRSCPPQPVRTVRGGPASALGQD